MKYALIAASAFVAATVVAQHRGHQHRGHQHQELHQKREIVWETDVETVTETIPITTTIWVDAGGAETTISTDPSGTAGEFYQTSTSAEIPKVIPSTLSTSSTPTPTPSVAAAAVPVVPAAKPETASTTPVAVVPSTPATPAVVASSAPSTDTSSSGYSGACDSASPCDGDITFYDTGLGACGWNNDGLTEHVVALPWGLMGTQSNGNPFCNMTITITKDSKTTTALVVDKCMGCRGHAIDLSRSAFDQLADESVGRTTATWHFN